MTDRELLELAAKAAGYGEVWYLEGHDTPYIGQKFKLGEPIGYQTFNPLTNDGDALRLAVKLRLKIVHADLSVIIQHKQYSWEWMGEMVNEDYGDRYAATRRAIVRAAAEIGKEMK